MNDDEADRALGRRSLLVGGAAAGAAVGGWFLLGRDVAPDAAPAAPNAFGDAIEYDPAYALNVTFDRPEGRTLAVTGRVVGRDHHIAYESGGRRFESYRVDGDGYVVVDGECQSHPGVGEPVAGAGRAAAEDPSEGEGPALEPAGTATIDGDEVTVLEVAAGGFQDQAGTLRYYVDAETRYLRRLVAGDTVVDYRDWGDVDPIRPPETDCSRPR